ncbi:MAG: aminoacyl-tRNA hydrolase [Planctomycetaceae bacterium]
MKLLVGLGNPGSAYGGTRHNVGFDVLDILARRSGSSSRRARFQGEVAQATIRGVPALLLWPLTWMNLSGSSVLAARDFYKIDDAEMLVICDDFNLGLGTIRMRPSGSAGGQNGLADILTRLGSAAVPRLRLGIGPVPPGWKSADFVLGRFSTAERQELGPVLDRAADAAEEWVAVGIQTAMNRYN